MVKGGAKSFSTSIKLIKHHALKSYNFWKVGWGYTLSIIKWTSKMAASIVIEISQSWWDKLKMHKLASTELSVVTSPLTCKLYLLKKSVFATLIICLLPEAQMVLNGKKRKKSKISWFFYSVFALHSIYLKRPTMVIFWNFRKSSPVHHLEHIVWNTHDAMP